MAIALLGVRFYAPPLSEIAARRAERDQLEASIADLTKRGARTNTIPRVPLNDYDTFAGRFGGRAERVCDCEGIQRCDAPKWACSIVTIHPMAIGPTPENVNREQIK
jgi:hypothetical protein